MIEVGVRDGEAVVVSLGELAGVVLDGPDALDVVRAWVLALLVRAGPIAAEVLTTAAALDWLLPGIAERGAAGALPGVRVVADEAAVLRLLEAESVSRARQLEDDEAPDVLACRRANPWEPVPAVVALVERVPEPNAERWEACCRTAARLGLGAVLLDGDGAGVRLTLGDDHVVIAAAPDELAARFIGVRCFALRLDEADDVLATLAEVEERPASDDAPGDQGADLAEAEPWPDPDGVTPDAAAGTGLAGPAAVDDNERAAPIVVRCFGPHEIVVGSEVVAKGLRATGKELLAWFVLRPEGASIDAAVEACWPDTEPSQVHRTFWRAGASLRTKVGALADPPTKLVVQVGSAYRLDAGAIDCDLWQFQAALGEAAQAEDDDAACAALRRAVALYRGPFLDADDYRWVEPVREDLHRRALDAHLRLAELEERHGALDASEEALRGAIGMDDCAEEPYRRLMVLQASRGRLDAVAATWRVLQRTLAAIDVDPEPATARLYRSLTTEPGERERRTPPVRLSS